MMNDNLKPLPYAVTKQQLVNMYLDQMSEIQIRRNINTIILDNRKKSPCNTLQGQKVWHEEFKEFLETYGLPKGYCKTQNF
jgi:hypothetical protein